MTRAELDRAAKTTAALIKTIRGGQVYALPATLHRLEGAQLILELLAHGEKDPAALVARLQEPVSKNVL